MSQNKRIVLFCETNTRTIRLLLPQSSLPGSKKVSRLANHYFWRQHCLRQPGWLSASFCLLKTNDEPRILICDTRALTFVAVRPTIFFCLFFSVSTLIWIFMFFPTVVSHHHRENHIIMPYSLAQGVHQPKKQAKTPKKTTTKKGNKEKNHKKKSNRLGDALHFA